MLLKILRDLQNVVRICRNVQVRKAMYGDSRVHFDAPPLRGRLPSSIRPAQGAGLTLRAADAGRFSAPRGPVLGTIYLVVVKKLHNSIIYSFDRYV